MALQQFSEARHIDLQVPKNTKEMVGSKDSQCRKVSKNAYLVGG